jgi:ribulose-5-phosphate 4-epimerase/fuculose-1-phosphate aldolase
MPTRNPSLPAASQREDLCRTAASLFARGYVHGTTGNISLRLPDEAGYLITPTDACLGALSADDLAHVAIDGTQLSGAPASKTLALHRAIYDAAPDAGCVIHTHSTQLVALTLVGVWTPEAILPPITPYFAMKVGRVPLIPYARPGDPAVAQRVAQTIQQARARGHTLRAVMLDRLGPNVWHGSLQAASAALEELEETAKLWLLTKRQATPLSDAQLAELRQRFDAAW